MVKKPDVTISSRQCKERTKDGEVMCHWQSQFGCILRYQYKSVIGVAADQCHDQHSALMWHVADTISHQIKTARKIATKYSYFTRLNKPKHSTMNILRRFRWDLMDNPLLDLNISLMDKSLKCISTSKYQHPSLRRIERNLLSFGRVGQMVEVISVGFLEFLAL